MSIVRHIDVLLIEDVLSYLDGKCGICGEPYDKPVKLFKKGGAMYKGKIVQTYTQGQQIDVKVMVRAVDFHFDFIVNYRYSVL